MRLRPNGDHTAREKERNMEEGVFLCCFVVFVSFFEQGKKATTEVVAIA